jgi:gp16 family phage-associated protein
MKQTTKTAQQVREEFIRAGVNVTEWARTHGFARMTVVDVMRGRRQGLRGEAHKVAVALGLKAGEVVDVAQFKQPKPLKPLKKAA